MRSLGDRSFADARRGASSVLGFTLIFGFSLVVVGGVVLLGSAAISDFQAQAETEHAESAFQNLDAQAAQVALGDSDVQTIDLGIDENGEGPIQVKYEGQMTVRQKNGPVLFRHDLGRIEYEAEGRTVAYQGGGVWRGTGDSARMVSPPEIHYRDGTLTLPVVVMSPGEDGSGNEITFRDKSKAFDLGPSVVENDVVVLEIKSRYYAGWAEYFRTRLGDTTVEVDESTETVTVELGRPEIIGQFDQAVLASGVDAGEVGVRVDNGNSEIDGPVTSTGTAAGDPDDYDPYPPTENADVSLTPLDGLIDAKTRSASHDDDVESIDVDGSRELKNGNEYYDDDGVSLGNHDDVDVDLAGGDVTLYVEGDVEIDQGSITVDPEADHIFRVYVTGDVRIDNGDVVVDSGGAKHVQIYGRSDTQVGIRQAEFEGVIYAPRRTQVPGDNTAVDNDHKCSLDGTGNPPIADFCVLKGNAEIKGALIGAPTSASQKATIEYDSQLSSISPSLNEDELAPPLTYLHLSANQVTVDGGSSTGSSAALETPTVMIDSVDVAESSGDHEVEVDWSASGEQLDEVKVTVIDVVRETESESMSVSGDSEAGTTTVTVPDPTTNEYEVVVTAVNAHGAVSSDQQNALCTDCS